MRISDYMRSDHRSCDTTFSELENEVAEGRIKEAGVRFDRFEQAFLHHFGMEEEVLFPAIEERTGTQGGPTQVMRMEHEQMRRLMAQMQSALQSEEKERFLGLSETFMILVQQHNMKEEQVLYTMADSILEKESGRVLGEMKAVLA